MVTWIYGEIYLYVKCTYSVYTYRVFIDYGLEWLKFRTSKEFWNLSTFSNLIKIKIDDNNLNLKIYIPTKFWSNLMVQQGKNSIKRSKMKLEKEGNQHLKGFGSFLSICEFNSPQIFYTS